MRIRKTVSLLLVLVMLIGMLTATQISTTALTSGDYEYEMYTDNSVVITYYDGKAADTLTIPAELGGYPVAGIDFGAFMMTDISKVVLPDTLEYIGDFAFADSTLSDVVIPENVSYVGMGAFSGTQLTDFIVSEENPYYKTVDGVLFDKDATTLVAYPPAGTDTTYIIPEGTLAVDAGAFCYDTKLTEVVFPNTLTFVGEGAFVLSALTKVELPASVEYIDAYAFTGSEALAEVSVDGTNLTYVAPDAFDETPWFNSSGDKYFGPYLYKSYGAATTNLREETKIIGERAFSGQENLSKIVIFENVEYIYPTAFEGCSGLTTIEVFRDWNPHYTSVDGVLYNDDLTEIVAFPQAKELTSYTLPDSTVRIGDYAFQDCKGLQEIIIPDTVTEIGDGAFAYCSKLRKISLSDNVEYVGYDLFYGCSSLADITIPEGCIMFSDVDFETTAWYKAQPEGEILYLCNNAIGYKGDYDTFTFAAIAEGTVAISTLSFYGYENLESVTIPDSVKTIGEWAFEDCAKLTEVTIPASVDEIGAGAFGYTFVYDSKTWDGYDVPVEGFVIKGYTNSSAEQYAIDNGFEFISVGVIELPYVLGDVDMNGDINVKDATAIQKYLAELITFTAQQKTNADFKQDGNINVRDATAIQKYIAGLEY